MHRQVIEFSKYNPSGNMTILVHSKHHPNEYATIANQLMATTHVCCEQVGFIESTNHNNWETYHLVMSGNEFCGNATMSYIHYLQEHQLLQHSQCQLKVSGYSQLVPCKVHNHRCYEVGMPQVQQITPRQLVIAGQLYHVLELTYESYIHFVVPTRDISVSFKQQVEQFVRTQRWNVNYKTIGVMLFDMEQQFLQPLIYIPEVQSLIWENSCGSGAASIGVFQQYRTNQASNDFKVNQPGGSILVSSTFNEQMCYLTSIKGQVSTVATGQAYIEQETKTYL
ncbi:MULTISPECIES: histidine racemase CntK [Staphylococcus]|uniref:histidine racemase CntK n=1 Tax=Staphylococcus TaxID=1279 RepID=UPI000CD2EF3D|nr:MULTISPECIES: histidine racemase CntK [Staphylococcus]MDI9230756.1 histidine racemase CntK [Staphylococcus caprae]POA04576.1 diaminopimelate epimerase [Staphylococcus caprae]SUL94324.1 Putative Similar to diaminopimelate epimerase [Staphylococcus caprae]HCG74493.1 histidine racemase CntK [Staphylococcus sp.]